MAGFYPDVPAPKMALDKDGTQWFLYDNDGDVISLTSGQIASMTGAETRSASSSWQVGGFGGPAESRHLSAVFPEKRDIYGVYALVTMLNGTGFSPPWHTWETSVNTTNGTDGDWVTLVASAEAINQYNNPEYRLSITDVSATGVRGVRSRHTDGSWGANWSAFHIYGVPTPGQTLNRLAMWHPTLDEEASGTIFDWGDVPRDTSAVRTFRVKNLSASMTAETVRVALSSIVEASPTVVGQHSLSLDNVTYVSQIALGDLDPDEVTPVLYLKRVTPDNAQGSLWLARVFAEATSWA